MSDNEIREILIKRKKAQYKQFEEEARKEYRAEFIKGFPAMLGMILWIYLIAALG